MFLRKIQNLPESARKIILWSIVILLALGLLSWWASSVKQRMESFQKEKFIEELKLPKFEMPKIEMPEISETQLKKWEEMMQEAQ